MDTSMTNSLYLLLQLCDSNFPSGAFSHSFGFETMIQEEKITNADSFLEALKGYIRQSVTYVDGLGCRLVYESLESGRFPEVLEWDHYLYAANGSRETRLANKRMGERMAKLCIELFPSSFLEDYVLAIQKKLAYGHPACVFAIVLHSLSIPLETTLEAYLFSSLTSLVQNAVRGIPLGQTDGQRILIHLQPELEQAVKKIKMADAEAFGATSPGLEVAQMKHETLSVRLFMS